MNDQNIVELSSEIERIDSRVAHIEKIASTVEEVVEKGVEAWTEHLKYKRESHERGLELESIKHQREIELENLVHKRAVIITGVIGFGVMLLVFFAMFLGYIDLVRTILTSSLAVGAGFSLKGFFRKQKN